MRLLFITICLFTVVACNQDPSKDKAVDTNPITFKRKNSSPIAGNWTLCSRSVNGTMIQANACLKVSFNTDRTGFVTYPSLASEYFQWTQVKDTLIILYASKDTSHIFTDTTYLTSINAQASPISLEIDRPDLGEKFYLSRSF